MFNMHSISNKLRLSYLLFAVLLCCSFISIFHMAEERVEALLVESYLLQQLQLSDNDNKLEHTDNQLNVDKYKPYKSSKVSIYTLQTAPKQLKALASNEMQVLKSENVTGKEADLYFFKYHYHDQDYILSYLDTGSTIVNDTDRDDPTSNQYPVLAMFEELENIFYKALIGAIGVSLLVALVFSYFAHRAIVKPISDLKKAVEADTYELEKLTNLPSEVGVLARAIDDKNNKLFEYLKREQLFTGDVSHELRTPLTIIMGASEVLSLQLEDNSKALEFTKRINTTAKETSDIISALLLLSRAPEKLDKPLTSINHIVNSEVTRLRYLIQHKSVTCKVQADNDYYAFVRPELLKMAMGNLIKNAFQYTDEGEVIISIDDKTITVIDTGLGIPDSMMPLLYKRFERVEPNSINVEGSGLGLSIVQRIMTHLGWTLTHTSNVSNINVSKGSTFTVFYN